IDVTQGGPGAAEERVALATSSRHHARPETYDQALVEAYLQDALHELGLTGKRVGIELEFVPGVEMNRLHALFPDTQFVNSSPLIRELRLIKTAAEIALIRRGVKLTEHGIMASLEGLDEQTIAQDIRARYHE